MKLFASFTKAEEQDDGTLMVEGIASTESVDAQGEIVKSSAMEAALPDYMRHGTGALREMHQPLAAGTAMASVDAGVTTIKAHVVDPVAVKKVQAGVYKGFSIGGKVTERDSIDKNTITGLKLVEISLVDRPANPDAVLSMWKAEDLEEDAPIAKSMWQVERLASILCDLRCLQSDTAWEASYEGDSSPIPAKLKEAVGALADILVELVGEEVQEMKDGMDPQVIAEVVIEAAEPIADVAKADPEEPGPEDDDGAIGKVEQPDLAKVEDMIAKAVAAALEPLSKANEALQAEVTALKAVPAPRGAVMAIGKGEEIGGVKADEVEPVRKADGSIDEVATEMKKVHRVSAI